MSEETADTLTDEQIRELQGWADERGKRRLAKSCMVALFGASASDIRRGETRKIARMRVARAIAPPGLRGSHPRGVLLMTRRVVKRCSLCKSQKRPARFTCTNCAASCCESIMAAPVPGALPAWCGTCARLPLGSPERIARCFKVKS